MKSVALSVKTILDDEIARMQMGAFYRSVATFIEGANGTRFEFGGLKDQTIDSIKSYEGVDICWVEEADRLSQASYDVLIPTIRQGQSGMDGQLWFSFNPRYADDAVYKRFVENKTGPETVLINVNWRDNRFFPKVLETERLWLKEHDPEKYLNIWEGNIKTISEARIFRNWRIERFVTPPGTRVFFGADWGFGVDPSCVVGCWFDDANRTMYVDRESWEKTTDIAQLGPLFARCPGARRNRVAYDSSKPELGKELKKQGYRMFPARKGAGSVNEGIEFLQSWKIVIHPNCVHTIKEMGLYSYKVDPRTEKVILPAEPEDKHNHIIDSLRYATESMWARNRADWLKRANAA